MRRPLPFISRRAALLAAGVALLAARPAPAAGPASSPATRSTGRARHPRPRRSSTSRATAPARVAYVKRVDGVDHVFVARFDDGAFQAARAARRRAGRRARSRSSARRTAGRLVVVFVSGGYGLRRRTARRRGVVGADAARRPGRTPPSTCRSTARRIASFTARRRRAHRAAGSARRTAGRCSPEAGRRRSRAGRRRRRRPLAGGDLRRRRSAS